MSEKLNLLPKVEELKDEVIEPIFARNLIGLFETVSTAPTGVPKNFLDQIKIYVNGATLRLYWYDTVANTWHYVTATA